jgi:hypothetical protein
MQAEQAIEVRDRSIAFLKALGFRVTKPKAKAKRPLLNAIGKPFGANYDPNYKMKHRLPPISRLCKPMPRNTPWKSD